MKQHTSKGTFSYMIVLWQKPALSSTNVLTTTHSSFYQICKKRKTEKGLKYKW